ncbi:MAG TPA: tRNA (adenosine(37)-N6)-threonylcarbamoyltransferase complex transferase subunit TsaD [Bacilli bacterium]|nr:tRNA (adenosine(37)-N6)-threonylcarbamoyltransferase complex transferase subunit TsaD [Bacilli bacterium]
MKERVILAIETSCDETAIAIMRGKKLLANVVSSQIAMHATFGGVVPEIASRLHTENMIYVLDQALNEAQITLNDVDVFAVTRGPGLIGALHVGMQLAKTLALIYQKPLIPVHHLAAHIYASEFVTPLKFPLLAVIVSGGHTELVLMQKHLDFKIIGETKDDAIGECYDKVARVLNLGYPGGVPIDKLAREGKVTYQLPKPIIRDSFDFSFSGLKTHVINIVNQARMKKEEINVANLCASFQDVAINAVVDRALEAALKYDVKQVVIAGGVSANSYLRELTAVTFEKHGIEAAIPPLWCCTDQAAMIAMLATYLDKEALYAESNLGVDPNWLITDFKNYN